MNKFVTLIIVQGLPNQLGVPDKTIGEVAAELEAAHKEGKGYSIPDMDPKIHPRTSIYLPSWKLQDVVLISRVDLDAMEKERKAKETQDRIKIAN